MIDAVGAQHLQAALDGRTERTAVVHHGARRHRRRRRHDRRHRAARTRQHDEAAHRDRRGRGARRRLPLHDRRPSRRTPSQNGTRRRACTSSAAATRCSPRPERIAARPARPGDRRPADHAARDARRPRSSPPGVRGSPAASLGVDDRYDRTRYLPAWPASVRTDIGPIGALTVNDGLAGPAGTGAAVDRSRGQRRGRAQPAARRARRRGRPGRAGPTTRPTARRAIATLDSPPLPESSRSSSSASDNLSAEMLHARARRPRRRRRPPRAACRRSATSSRSCDVDLTGASFVDGSGLAHDDRLTCATLLVGARPRRAAAVRAGRATAWRSRASAARSP